MATAKLTKARVEALSTSPANLTKSGKVQDAYLWDAEIPGFGVKVTEKGARTYLFQYRDKVKHTRRVTIGRHGRPWTVEKARSEAEQLFAQATLAKRGQAEDPAEVRTERRTAKTFADAVDLFLTEHVAVKKKPGTSAEYRRLLEKHVVPKLGKAALLDVGRADLARIHHGLRGTPYQANRVAAVLGSLFGWAIRHGHYRGENPAHHIEKYREEKKERFLAPAELAMLGAILARHEGDNPIGVAAIRMLILTGMRKMEVLTLRWEDIDIESGFINLPDSKTGAKSIPLSAPAATVIKAMGEVREQGNPYVFIGRGTGSHLIGLQKMWERWRDEATIEVWSHDDRVGAVIARLGEKLERRPTVGEIRDELERDKIEPPRGMDDVRLHDFRHSFASVGASGGDSLLIIGSILGHANQATTQRYAHLYDDPRKAAAERIAGQIEAGLSGRAGEVVAFSPRSA